MPLHESVGEIFLEAGARAAFSNSLRRFLVEDRGTVQDDGTHRDELRVVLLLESPHIDEVKLSDEICNRHPLAGESGKDVTKVLMEWLPGLTLQDNEPIGSLVNQEHCDVRWLGIMNVSQLPFQSKAYCRRHIPQRENDCRGDDNWDDYITCMDYIKDHLGRKTYKGKNNAETQRLQRLQCKIEKLETAIIVNLRGRLESMKSEKPDVLLVCCGEVAQKFYKKTDVSMCNTDAPHPSYRHWIYYLQLKKIKTTNHA